MTVMHPRSASETSREPGFFVKLTPYRHHTLVWAEFAQTLPIHYAACECVCPQRVAHAQALPRHTLQVEYGRIEITEADIAQYLINSHIEKAGFDKYTVCIEEGLIHFSGHVELSGKWMPFYVQIQPVVSGPEEISFLFVDQKIYGLPHSPAPLLVETLWKTLAGAHTEKASLSSWTFKPFELLCKNIFPQIGWKIPRHKKAEHMHLSCENGVLRVECSASEQAFNNSALVSDVFIEQFSALQHTDEAIQHASPEEAFSVLCASLQKNPSNFFLQKRFLQTTPVWNIRNQETLDYTHSLLFQTHTREDAYMALLMWALRDQRYQDAEMVCSELLYLKEKAHNPYHIANVRHLLQKIAPFAAHTPPSSDGYSDTHSNPDDNLSETLKTLYKHTLHNPNDEDIHADILALFKKKRIADHIRVPYYTMLGVLIDNPHKAALFTQEAATLSHAQNPSHAREVLRSFLLRDDSSEAAETLKDTALSYGIAEELEAHAKNDLSFLNTQEEHPPETTDIYNPESLHRCALRYELESKFDEAFVYFCAERLWRTSDAHNEHFVQKARSIRIFPKQLPSSEVLRSLVFHQGYWGVLQEFITPMARVLEFCYAQKNAFPKEPSDALSSDHNISVFLQPLFDVFNMPQCHILVSHGSARTCTLDVFKPHPTLSIGIDFLRSENNGLLYFLTARLLARYHYGFSLCGVLDTDEASVLYDAAAHVLCNPLSTQKHRHHGTSFQHYVSLLHKHMPTQVAASVGASAHIYLSEKHHLDIASWQTACLQSADRLALVCASDPEEALRALHSISPHRRDQTTAHWIRENPHACSLYQYALSDTHIEARDMCGVAFEKA